MTNGENEAFCFFCHKSIRPEIRFCPHCGKKQPQMDASNSNKDPYDILQVSREAEKEVIDAAYRGLARKYHPDTNKSQDASAKMQDINWAYEVIGNEQSRNKWDQVHNPEKFRNQQAREEKRRDEELRKQKVQADAEQRKKEQAEEEKRRVEEELRQQKARAEAYQRLKDLEEEHRRVDEEFKRKYGNPDHLKDTIHGEPDKKTRTETPPTKENLQPNIQQVGVNKEQKTKKFWAFPIILVLLFIGYFVYINPNSGYKTNKSDIDTVEPKPLIQTAPIETNTPAPSYPPNTQMPTLKALQPGDTIFYDDFSDKATGWGQTSDQEVSSGYINSAYQISVNVPNMTYWFSKTFPIKNSFIEVTAEVIKPTKEGAFGISCRNSEKGGYFFFISEGGSYSIQKSINNGPFVLLKDWTSYFGYGYSIHHFSAHCIGNQLSILINGINLATVYDNDLTEGNIALVVGTYEKTPLIVAFDDLMVKVPYQEETLRKTITPEPTYQRCCTKGNYDFKACLPDYEGYRECQIWNATEQFKVVLTLYAPPEEP
jgi:curved DNA-binding protein CbpA